MRVLLDTHVLPRSFLEPKKVSRDQARLLREAARRQEPVAISAVTLLEAAMLFSEGRFRLKLTMDQFLSDLEASPAFRVLPISFEIARESGLLRNPLRDPADCAIVATARVYGLRLLTSDQRIIASDLVSTVE